MEEEKIEKALKYYDIDKCHKERVEIVDSVDDYFVFLKKYSTQLAEEQNEYFFRGISKPEQKYSRITRQYFNDATRRHSYYNIDSDYEINAFNKELQYIRKFEQKAAFLLKDSHTTLDLVATAQHYTIMTRLIDWSLSPLVATLFSLHHDVNKEDDCDYYMIMIADKSRQVVIYGLPTSKHIMNQTPNYIIYEDMLMNLMKVFIFSKDRDRKKAVDKVQNFFGKLFTQTNTIKFLNRFLTKNKITTPNVDGMITSNRIKFMQNRPMFLETSYSNERLTNQRGLFQLSILPNKAYIDSCLYNFNFVLINKQLRNELIKICDKLGISYYGIMPDCQSIACEINRMGY